MKKVTLQKAAAVGLSLAMALSLAACGGGSGDSGSTTAAAGTTAAAAGTTAAAGGETTAAGGSAAETQAPAAEKEEFEIAVQNGPEPATLDPNEVNANDQMAMVLHMYEGLMRYSPSGVEVEPGVAEGYEMSEDGLTYTFHIRDGVTWSDGQPLVAGDFIYAWKRLITGGYDNSDFLKMIVNAEEIRKGEADVSTLGVEAPDDKTIVVSLVNPCAYFPQLLAAAVCSPLRQDAVESGDQWYADPATNIGNGPFMMEEWVNQDHITMVANPNYWEKEKVGPSKVTFMLMDDANTALASFESGQIMFAATYPSEELARLASSGYVVTKLLPGTYYIMINYSEKNDNPALQDPNVRRALALAIDREYIQNTMRADTGVVAADTWVGPGFLEPDGSEFYSKSTAWYDNSTYEQNCEEAKQLLADAGYPNGEGFPTLKYTINNDAGHQEIAEFVQECWSNVLNINCTIDSQEWGVFLDLRNSRDYQTARGGWTADFYDPASLFELWITEGGNNDTSYTNAEYDELYYAAQAEPDPAKRMDLFHQAEELLREDMAMIPVYYYSEVYLLKTDEYDGVFDYLGFPMFKYTTKK